MYNIVVNHLLLRKKKCFLDSLFEAERPVVKKNLIDPRLQCLQLSIFVVLLSLECIIDTGHFFHTSLTQGLLF